MPKEILATFSQRYGDERALRLTSGQSQLALEPDDLRRHKLEFGGIALLLLLHIKLHLRIEHLQRLDHPVQHLVLGFCCCHTRDSVPKICDFVDVKDGKVLFIERDEAQWTGANCWGV